MTLTDILLCLSLNSVGLANLTRQLGCLSSKATISCFVSQGTVGYCQGTVPRQLFNIYEDGVVCPLTCLHSVLSIAGVRATSVGKAKGQ